MADFAQIIAAGVEDIPANYTVPNAQEIIPMAVNAVFDGSGAASDFVPTLVFVSDGGTAIARVPCATTVAAGGSAEVTWAPFLDKGQAAAPTGPVSAYAEVTAGPIYGGPNISVPASGVAAIPWYHFRASDFNVFATGPNVFTPNNTRGDILLIGQPAGLYKVTLKSTWENGAYAHKMVIGNSGPPESVTQVQVAGATPDNPAGLVTSQLDVTTQEFSSVGVPNGFTADASNFDGAAAHNVRGVQMRVSYWTCADPLASY